MPPAMERTIRLRSMGGGVISFEPKAGGGLQMQIRQKMQEIQPTPAPTVWLCKGTCWQDDDTEFTLREDGLVVEGEGRNRGGPFKVQGARHQDGYYDLVFTNEHGEWPVQVSWVCVPGLQALSGRSTGRQQGTATFEVEEDADEAPDFLLYTLNGKLVDLDTIASSEIPSDVMYVWTTKLNAKKIRLEARKDLVMKRLFFLSDSTWGRDLAEKVAMFLIEAGSQALRRRWAWAEKISPDSNVQSNHEAGWVLRYDSRLACFLLAFDRKTSSLRWRSKKEFVDAFADMSDKTMASYFICVDTGGRAEPERISGTLTKHMLQQLLGLKKLRAR